MAGGSDYEGPLQPDKPLAEITRVEYMYYKDRFLTANKAQIILRKLMELLGEGCFFNGYLDYLAEHPEKPATLKAFQASLENATGMDLDDFFQRWFFTSDPLPVEWKPGYDAKD